MKRLLTLTAALFTLPGFSTAEDKKPAAETKPAAEAKSAGLAVGGLTFKAAAPWQVKKEPRKMSAGGLTMPGKEKAAGIEADFYHFGVGGGGGVEANVQRWQKQFEPDDDGKLPEPKHEEVIIGGRKVLFVTFKGTFLSGSVMDAKRTPRPGYTMTGVIIPSEETGDIFIKISGPDAAMAASQEAIKKLVGTALPAAK